MHSIDMLASTIIQRAATIKKTIKQVKKIWARNQVIDILNIRNKLLADLIDNFLFNFYK